MGKSATRAVLLTGMMALGFTGSLRAESLLKDVWPFGNGVQLLLSETARYEAFMLESPPRLIIDLFDTGHSGSPREVILKGRFIYRVRTDQFSSPPNGVTRVVLDLERPVDYEIKRQGRHLTVRLEELKDSIGDFDTQRRSEPVPAGLAPREDAILQKVHLEGDQGILSVNRQVEYRTFALENPDRLIVDLLDTKPISWARLHGEKGRVLNGIRTGRFSSARETVARVVFDLAKDVPYRAEWRGSDLVVDFGEDEPDPSGGVRDFTGLLLDNENRGMSGIFLLRFYSPGDESAGFWNEALYVKADSGFFSVRLGEHRPVPAKAEIQVATPVGAGWSVQSTEPHP